MPAAESGPVEAVEIPKLKLEHVSHELQRNGSIRTKNAIAQTQQRAAPKFGASASSPKIGGDDRGVAHATEQTKQRAALKPKFGTSASSPSKIGGDDRGVAHAVEQTKQRAAPKLGTSASSPKVGGDAFGVAHCRAQTEQRKPTNAVSDNLGRSRGSSLADDAFMAHACKMTKDKAKSAKTLTLMAKGILGDDLATVHAREQTAAKAHKRKPDPPRAPMWDSLAPVPSASYEAPGSKTFSYDELKGVIPAGVDPAKKEQYLSDADFEKIMKSPRGVFNDMKAWKQAQVKKAAGLY